VSPGALLLAGLSTGLVAGGASCAAVQGGLLASAVSRRDPAQGNAPLPVAPAGAFLAGKLAAHTALGALLGVFGAALQPSPRTRAVLLLAAAVLMTGFAAEMLGARRLSRWLPRPPTASARLVRSSARRPWALAPALLGVATVLVPCGVTLSMELLAVTSGSALSGAAVMAGFVTGTAPLFGLLGYLFAKTARVARGRLRIATGVVVIGVAAWTAVSGLRLGGWIAPPGTTSTAASSSAVRTDGSGQQVITVLVHGTAYLPGSVAARAGSPTTLVLRSRHVSGCSQGFVIAGLGIQKILPPDGQTVISLGRPGAGTLRYTCATGMYGGTITFDAGPAPRIQLPRPARAHDRSPGQ
jgi:uncharacterized protein